MTPTDDSGSSVPGETGATANSSDRQSTGGDGSLTAGVARVDITPETGRAFQGYVRPDIRAEGVGIRLFARALVLADGDQKLALVSADLLYGIDKPAVVDRVRDRGFTRETVLYAGTHTHAGSDAGEWTAAQVADAVAEADANREPAAAGWASATVEGVNRSRSLEAHLANHGLDLYPGTGSTDLDPEGDDHPRETTLRVLRVEGREGTPIGAWAQFPVHPTAFSPHNTVYSADLAGAAVRQFAAQFDETPVVVFQNGAQGDLIPVYEACNQYALADLLGGRLADGMLSAWDRAGTDLSATLPLAARGTRVTYEGQTVEPGVRVGNRALFGLPFLGGGENGPSFLYGLGLEGTRRPASLADPVHGRKIPVAPAPWDATVETQAVRVGDRLLLGVPGEPTVETGRRSAAAAATAAPDGISDVAVVGLANGYAGYFTTPEEYDQQHYEGGHTTFGKHSEALLRTTFADLAAALDGTARDRPDGGEEQKASEETRAGGEGRQHSPAPPVGAPSVGSLVRGPDGPVERLSVVTVEWSGGPGGRDRPVGDPFVRLERVHENETETIETDLGLGFVWTVENGQYTARYEIPRTLETGRYRLRVTGTGYDLPTEQFEVRPATGLRVRGVELTDRNGDRTPRLRFRGQYPPPDPDRHLRHRPVEPRGGAVDFRVGDTGQTATWNAQTEAWTAPADGVGEGDTVTVPAGGFEDSAGNRSGEAVTLSVGETDAVDWPPSMGPGGGRPPGPFGVGTWPW